jgi:quinol monooxygenase YgiN
VTISQIFELRRYELHPGQRDVLIELFDRELVETQEAEGMEIVGQFRDLDDPDAFVWIRGFPDMATRHAALTAFYRGPAWQAHSPAANPTMVSVDDVLLLRPVSPRTTFQGLEPAHRPVGDGQESRSLIEVTIHHFAGPVTRDVTDRWTAEVEPLLVAAGSHPLALLETESAENTFTALPVREGEHVLVRVARYESPADHADVMERLATSTGWRAAERSLSDHLTRPTRRLRLRPTARSLLR